MKTKILFIVACVCFLLASCEYDNYDAPSAKLSGRVVYNDAPVGVRTNGTQLELWQDGYELYTKIPVYIAQDGTFSASLFNGQYKLVRLSGAPWEDQPMDTIRIEVKGNTVVDVPISFAKSQSGGIQPLSISFFVKSVNFYLGEGILTDHNKNEYKGELDLSGLVLGQETTMTATIPEKMLKNGYAFARIGVQSNKSNEYFCPSMLRSSF